jgi:hypothetical protein
MRLWSLHPKYLDTKGIVALWREALLAQAVLRGDTRGYRHHPQLERFKAAPKPMHAIAAYLSAIHREAECRNFIFDVSKIGPGQLKERIPVTQGQIDYEFAHLKKKLAHRDGISLKHIDAVMRPEPHPLFEIVPGVVEKWERV